MTEQLYLADSTAREFEATVERALDDRVVLDRTHFYPTGGGQPNDTGTLRFDGGEAAVTDVAKRDTVYHSLDGPVPGEGTAVTGEIDWERRYAHMRYHTAQHLLSAVLLEEFDAPTVGNQLYADRARLDATHPKFSETDLADVEARMNELVDEALPVRHYTMDREVAEAELDAERTRIDLLPSSITELRIVEVGGGRSSPESASGEGTGPRAGDADEPFDRTACAGTHVAGTDELGAVTVTGRTTQGSETERVEFTLE